MTEFLADFLKIKTHQKVLINKQKKYQVQSLAGSRTGEQSELSNYSSSFVIHSDDESDENEQNAHKELNDCYFEQWMLDDDKRNVGWLLSEFDPDSDIKDRILLEGITGFKEQGS